MAESRDRAFTLVELLIAITVIAILAAFAIPSLLSARLQAAETNALGTLRTISAAEAIFRSNRFVNRNRNEDGEYGYMGEMTGLVPPRDGLAPIRVPLLGGGFRAISGGVVTRTGYVFRISLVGTAGVPAPEAPAGGEDPADPADDYLSEALWVCYAWPAVAGVTGKRVFVVNSDGNIAWQDNEITKYSGLTNPPPQDAAFTAANDLRSPIAQRRQGIDGSIWYPLR